MDWIEDLIYLMEPFISERKISKGHYLFRDSDLANEVFYIKEGVIQLKKIIPDGKEFTLRILSEGKLIVETKLFENVVNYHINAIAMEDSKVYAISKDDFETQLMLNPTIATNFFIWLNQQYTISQSIIRDLLINGKKGALYSLLIRLANSFGEKTEDGILIRLQLTNQELGSFCGTSREVVNRLLSELRKQNVLSIENGLITIHDLNYLREAIQCENCPKTICTIN